MSQYFYLFALCPASPRLNNQYLLPTTPLLQVLLVLFLWHVGSHQHLLQPVLLCECRSVRHCTKLPSLTHNALHANTLTLLQGKMLDNELAFNRHHAKREYRGENDGATGLELVNELPPYNKKVAKPKNCWKSVCYFCDAASDECFGRTAVSAHWCGKRNSTGCFIKSIRILFDVFVWLLLGVCYLTLGIINAFLCDCPSRTLNSCSIKYSGKTCWGMLTMRASYIWDFCVWLLLPVFYLLLRVLYFPLGMIDAVLCNLPSGALTSSCFGKSCCKRRQ